MDLTALLAELCAVPAPTGAETELADLLQDRWTPRCAEVRRDGVGNVIARVGGSGPRVLVQAHMDQIGYVVRHITDEGFLLLDGAQGDRRNGPERRHHVGQPVRALARDGALGRGAARGCQRPRPHRRAARGAPHRLRRLLGRARPARPRVGPRAGPAPRRAGHLLRRDARDRAAARRAEHGQPRRPRRDGRAAAQRHRGGAALRAVARGDGPGGERPARRQGARPPPPLGRGGRARRRAGRRRPRRLRAPARDPTGRRPDRRPPRHGDHLRPPADDAPARARAHATTCPRRTGCSPATDPTAWRCGSRARRRRC